MPAYVIWIIVAGLLYTIVVWTTHWRGQLSVLAVGMFFIAFASDLTGTGLMARTGGGLRIDFHAVLGLAALVIMGIHALWAWSSMRSSLTGTRLFHECSPWAYALWLIAFGSGLAMHLLGVNLAVWLWILCVLGIAGFVAAMYYNNRSVPASTDQLDADIHFYIAQSMQIEDGDAR